MNRNKTIHYKILSMDPALEAYSSDIALRMKRHLNLRTALQKEYPTLTDFADSYTYFGFNRTKDGWVFREWLPGADEVWLMGDFNHWNRTSHPLVRTEGGVWEMHTSDTDFFRDGQFVKLLIRHGSEIFERIPSHIRGMLMDPATKTFCGRIYHPAHRFQWTDGNYKKCKITNPVIYETHIGLAGEKESVGTYREFADTQLSRIAGLGYNCILLMAIQSHPYYASYGYQVTGFFAASSRFGTQDDLKYLINKAHSMNLFVILDLIHAQASANVGEGLARMDGTDDQYFLSGERGIHPIQKTRLFNYGRREVLRFLLSNIHFWQDEYHFDGFRFTGITSMIYHNHGIGNDFKTYNQYFSMNTNVEAITYLQLANELIHEVNPFAISIAEEGSGMPGMCIPVRAGGIGFDYLFSGRIPDFWGRLLKNGRDETWNVENIWEELTRRRQKERIIAACETHDQSLYPNQALIFRMAGAEMYTGMRKNYTSPVIDRAIDLHKMFRFATLILSSDGYLNYMGNEFGHPEWIDFPREGNNWSAKYARRQWSLVENHDLKYEWLQAFDCAMLHFVRKYRVLTKPAAIPVFIDCDRRVLSFYRGDLIYIMNFNTTVSYPDYYIHADHFGPGKYQVIFSSDAEAYGGKNRTSMDYIYTAVTETLPESETRTGFTLYVPCRTAVVLQKLH